MTDQELLVEELKGAIRRQAAELADLRASIAAGKEEIDELEDSLDEVRASRQDYAEESADSELSRVIEYLEQKIVDIMRQAYVTRELSAEQLLLEDLVKGFKRGAHRK